MEADDDDEYGVPAKRTKGVLAAAAGKKEGGGLYGEAGQYNPHAARAARKKVCVRVACACMCARACACVRV